MTRNKITLNIEDIKPYKNNPRINDRAVDVVAKSIKQCGYISLICVDENNEILCGHTRLRALEQLGYTNIDVLQYLGLTDAQKRKFRILDNKTNEYAEWDNDLLKEELQDLDFEDLDIDWNIDDIIADIDNEEDEDVDLHSKKLLKCPVCGHINEEKAFRNYEDTD